MPNSTKKQAIKLFPKHMVADALPLMLVFSCFMLAVQPDLRLAVPLLVGVTAFMTVLLSYSLFFGGDGKLHWPTAVILTVAILLRLFFLFNPPQLSDDIYRYLWDGENLLRGNNPYAAAPAAVTPPPDLQAAHARINHPEYVTIYPPAAQLIFAGGAALGGGITGLKALLVFFDLGLCALLMALLRQLDLPVWRSVLYAWNPLPVMEIAGSGHVDGAGLALLIAAIALLVPAKRESPTGPQGWRRYLLSGALLGSAGLVKLYPLFLTPPLLLLVPPPRRLLFLGGFLGAIALLLLPFLPHLSNLAATLDVYARNWEFSGFAFNLLRGVTGSGTAARMVLAGVLLFAIAMVTLATANKVRNASTGEMAGKEVMQGCYAIAMSLLLLTPTLHPWYALILAPFLVFSAGPAGLVFCWAVFLTYRVQIGYYICGKWQESIYITAVAALAPVAAFLLTKASQALRKRAS